MEAPLGALGGSSESSGLTAALSSPSMQGTAIRSKSDAFDADRRLSPAFRIASACPAPGRSNRIA